MCVFAHLVVVVLFGSGGVGEVQENRLLCLLCMHSTPLSTLFGLLHEELDAAVVPTYHQIGAPRVWSSGVIITNTHVRSLLP